MQISDYEVKFIKCYVDSLIERFMTTTACEEAEREYRKAVIRAAVDRLETQKTVAECNRVQQLAHEIESFLFLLSRGTAKMATDSRHEAGADFTFCEEISIECVCATLGDIDKSGLSRYLGEGIVDYNEKKRLLYARLTNSLCEKARSFYTHRNSGKPIKTPYVVFLSLGKLTLEWFEEDYGMALTDILLGRGNPTIRVNTKTGEIIDSGFDHTETFKKWNGAEITSNLFLCPYFRCVSGILLATRSLEEYSSQNVFLHINPFTNAPIDPSQFKDVVYWKANTMNEYQPYRDGSLAIE